MHVPIHERTLLCTCSPAGHSSTAVPPTLLVCTGDFGGPAPVCTVRNALRAHVFMARANRHFSLEYSGEHRGLLTCGRLDYAENRAVQILVVHSMHCLAFCAKPSVPTHCARRCAMCCRSSCSSASRYSCLHARFMRTANACLPRQRLPPSPRPPTQPHQHTHTTRTQTHTHTHSETHRHTHIHAHAHMHTVKAHPDPHHQFPVGQRQHPPAPHRPHRTARPYAAIFKFPTLILAGCPSGSHRWAMDGMRAHLKARDSALDVPAADDGRRAECV